jgi:hypothetical protein
VDAQVKVEKRFLPALAEALIEWFPQLGGRALAVSDVTVSKENVPTLPLVMVAFVRGTGTSPSWSRFAEVNLEDNFVIEFWLEPARYKKPNKTETPFWSYYDYESIRDTLLNNISLWQSPSGERVAYRSLIIQADSLAVTLTFGFVAVSQWCRDKTLLDQGERFVINFNLCTPAGTISPDCEEAEPVTPCL